MTASEFRRKYDLPLRLVSEAKQFLNDVPFDHTEEDLKKAVIFCLERKLKYYTKMADDLKKYRDSLKNNSFDNA